MALAREVKIHLLCLRIGGPGSTSQDSTGTSGKDRFHTAWNKMASEEGEETRPLDDSQVEDGIVKEE